tara:strand:- start:57 stop:284 length:228 start_codon:yes stop_codon:yes gene_type:complete
MNKQIQKPEELSSKDLRIIFRFLMTNNKSTEFANKLKNDYDKDEIESLAFKVFDLAIYESKLDEEYKQYRKQTNY